MWSLQVKTRLCWLGVLGDASILSALLKAGPATLPDVSVVRIQSGPEADLNASMAPAGQTLIR